MMKLHSIMAFTFCLALAGCGGGGDGGGDDAPDNTPTPDTPIVGDNGNPPSTGEEESSGIELATIPMAEGMDHLIPPGVPTLE